ncbi:stringent starvation protein SspA [Pelagibaculum spongiae]|uniref:Stringent starvation protein A n=1 Tax=Pelagibaculum spongiae TaxID=2080658 RepID=A0A2V1GXR7_9GAMM|nr:stringent starvation protein SspA [Pelagibaculum spongiae]PVZ71884.1 stringent starvation protein A [Pelagibaculum spongiae]
MATVANKRSVMTLYSDPVDLYSHQVRIVLAEKGVSFEVVDVAPERAKDLLADINPYGILPTLVDRDLMLYDAAIIIEYLDERFPHPPLLPVYPVQRAQCRLMMHRVEQDLYSALARVQSGSKTDAARARKEIIDSLVAIAPIFGEKPFFMSDEFTLVDCYFAPLLWRLPSLGIELPATARDIHEYQKRLFDRESFKASLTDSEREMRS